MRAELYLLVTTLLAAIGWIASKLVIEDMPGAVFIASRFVMAGLILLCFCYKSVIKLTLRQVVSTLLVGCFLGVGLQVWVHAMSISNSLAEGAFIMSLAMMIAPMVSWLLFKLRPNRAFWLALPVSILGMMLLTLSNGWQLDASQGYFFLSSMLMSVHFVLNKRIGANMKPLVSICLQLFAVGTVGTIYAWYTQPHTVEFTSSWLIWFTVSTVLATSIRYLLQTMGQYGAKLETAALIMILEPIWTMILSATMLGETLVPQKLIGCVMIVLSLFIYIKLSKRYAVTALPVVQPEVT